MLISVHRLGLVVRRFGAGLAGPAGSGPLPLRLGGQRAADALPAQGAVAAGGPPRQVGVAVHLGGRGQDVAARRAEVHVVAGQVAAVLGGAGEVDVQAAAGGAHVAVRVLEQPGAVEPAEGGVPVPGGAVDVDVQDVGAGGAGGGRTSW